MYIWVALGDKVALFQPYLYSLALPASGKSVLRVNPSNSSISFNVSKH